MELSATDTANLELLSALARVEQLESANAHLMEANQLLQRRAMETDTDHSEVGSGVSGPVQLVVKKEVRFPKFKGECDDVSPEEWVADLRAYFREAQLTDAEQAFFFKDHVQVSVLNKVRIRLTKEERTVGSAYVRAFENLFCDTVSEAELKDKLYKLKQESSETVESYAVRLLTLNDKLRFKNVSVCVGPRELVEIFIRGVNRDDMRTHLLTRRSLQVDVAFDVLLKFAIELEGVRGAKPKRDAYVEAQHVVPPSTASEWQELRDEVARLRAELGTSAGMGDPGLVSQVAAQQVSGTRNGAGQGGASTKGFSQLRHFNTTRWVNPPGTGDGSTGRSGSAALAAHPPTIVSRGWPGQTPSAGFQLTCYQCGQVGHGWKRCPRMSSSKGPNGVPQVVAGPTCYNCGVAGHISRVCPNRRVVQREHSPTCYNCGQGGHLWHYCPHGQNSVSHNTVASSRTIESQPQTITGFMGSGNGQ